MQIARHVAGCLRPPTLLGQADPVLACNDATPGQHLCKEIVERVVDSFAHSSVAIVTVCHNVDVNIAIPGVTKAGNRKSILSLHGFGEFHEIDQTTARHDYILI